MLGMSAALATGENIVASKQYVDTEVSQKQQKIGGGTNGTVITNTGELGTVGSKGVYQTGGGNTYNAQTDSLVEAAQVNTAIQNGLNAHVTCHEYRDGECYLWDIHQLSGTYLPQ